MNPVDLSPFVAGSIILTAVVVAAMVFFGVTGLARRLGVLSDEPDDLAGAARIARVDRWTAALILLAAAVALLVTFAFRGRAAIMGPLYIAGVAAAGYALVVLTDTGRKLLAAVPQSWLSAAQAFRIAGGVFLFTATYDALPAYFAIPAGTGDFVTGLVAPLVAVWWATGAPIARRAAWVWNVFGLLDLVVAVGIGSSLLVRPAAVLFGGSAVWLERAAQGSQPLGPPIFPIGSPLTLVPIFIVPIAILLHLLALRKLATEPAPDSLAIGSGWSTVKPSAV